MFAVALTDDYWFKFLRKNQITDRVNFWTPSPWNLQNLKPGSCFYFLRKAPIRLLGGGGKFVSYRNMTISDAWEHYGLGNGCENEADLLGKIHEYSTGDEIGCIELTECKFLYKPRYIDPAKLDVDVPKKLRKLKYFNGIDPFESIVWSEE